MKRSGRLPDLFKQERKLKMNILVSACLLGVSCRYDGDHNYDPSLKRIAEEHHLIPVCPESYGGLPVPRDPAEISKDRVY